MHVYRGTNSRSVNISQLQKSNTIYLVYICCNLKNKCLLLQIDNINLATNLENYYFYVMLIACKCMPFNKKTRL